MTYTCVRVLPFAFYAWRLKAISPAMRHIDQLIVFGSSLGVSLQVLTVCMCVSASVLLSPLLTTHQLFNGCLIFYHT